MRKRTAIIVGIIIVLSVIGVVGAVILITEPKGGMWIMAEEGEKDHYPTVVAPSDKLDTATLTALENPGEWVYVENQHDCWGRQYCHYNIEYNGQIYTMRVVFLEPAFENNTLSMLDTR